MHRVQRCGLLLLLFRGLRVSVRWILPSAVLKRMNRSRHRLGCGLGWPKEPCIKWDPASPNRRGNFGGYPPLKYIRLCKQQTLQQVGESVASEWTRGCLPRGRGDKCGDDVVFRHNSLTTCMYNDNCYCVRWRRRDKSAGQYW